MARGSQVRCPQCGAKTDVGRCRICGALISDAGTAEPSRPMWTPPPVTATPAPPSSPPPPPSPTSVPPPWPPPPPSSIPDLPYASTSPVVTAPGSPRPSRDWRPIVGAVAAVVAAIAGYFTVQALLVSDDDTPRASNVTLSVPSAVSSSERVTFTDPEGHFTAQFPTEPQRSEQPNPAPGLPPIVLWQTSSRSLSFGVARLELVAGSEFDLQTSANGAATAVGGTVVSATESTDAFGRPTIDYVVDIGGTANVHAFTVVDGTQVFVLQVVATSGGNGSDLLADFKASFKILP